MKYKYTGQNTRGQQSVISSIGSDHKPVLGKFKINISRKSKAGITTEHTKIQHTVISKVLEHYQSRLTAKIV